jgi:cobaltochelatase CobS
LEHEENSDGKIVCQIDNARVHSIQLHIRDNHPDWTIDRYKKEFPDAPVLSETAAKRLAQRASEKKKGEIAQTAVTPATTAYLHDVFGFGNIPAAMSGIGSPISISIFTSHSKEAAPYIAPIDENYVFQIDLLKKVIAGLELNMPTYLWGLHGTGKTTVLEQVHARTGRPFMRVQHTVNTEESHILGQWVVRSKPVKIEELDAAGAKHELIRQETVTEFQLGPLPTAMLHGFTYCADEYDFAMPSVTSVYQSVLEGKPLVIKEAPEHLRLIKPHPNFRFVATGNTNGVGDETGLYQGTLIGNAANYSRFGITEEVEYMEAKVEELVVMSQAKIERQDAAKLVKFAKQVREAFRDGKLSMTVSPRELIGSAKLAMAFGGNWTTGVKLAFANRLSRVDKKVVEEFAQRIWA